LGGFCKSPKVQIHQCWTISPPPPAIWDTWSWLASDVEILVIHAQGWTKIYIIHFLVDMKCKSLHSIRMRIWAVVAQKELDFINVDPVNMIVESILIHPLGLFNQFARGIGKVQYGTAEYSKQMYYY